MHLDIYFNHFASTVAKFSTSKLQLHAFFWSISAHREEQPLPGKGDVSAPKASEMTFLRQLLAHDILIKSGMTLSVSTR